ncbi:hypothetical protein E2C01_043356 [Portunus trituberculatus]|uniref:Uncharacterized protein n=1 Tax=Portunus trituberculatus TaxID=210409 RepID=A0A5B7FW87_PORTR|nr:hypothetical protein [Portunus trituberculatus]
MWMGERGCSMLKGGGEIIQVRTGLMSLLHTCSSEGPEDAVPFFNTPFPCPLSNKKVKWKKRKARQCVMCMYVAGWRVSPVEWSLQTEHGVGQTGGSECIVTGMWREDMWMEFAAGNGM